MNFVAIIITNQYIMANNDNNLEQKGYLYISTPTLETLVLSCINERMLHMQVASSILIF